MEAHHPDAEPAQRKSTKVSAYSVLSKIYEVFYKVKEAGESHGAVTSSMGAGPCSPAVEDILLKLVWKQERERSNRAQMPKGGYAFGRGVTVDQSNGLWPTLGYELPET